MAQGALRPLTPVKLGDGVTRNVRDAVMTGVYKTGEKISVGRLASTLQVSTMPVREALLALAHEGLLEPREKGGFRVAPLEREDIEDIFLIQAFITTELATRAVDIIDARTIAKLHRMCEQVDKLAAGADTERTRARIEGYNYNFHRTINKSVDAPRLHWFLRAATRYVPRHIFETLPAWTRLTIEEHPGIIEAFESRDVDLVRQRVQDHVDHAGSLIIANLEVQGFWSASAAASPSA